MRKILLCSFLALSLLFALSACASSEQESQDVQQSQPAAQQPQETAGETLVQTEPTSASENVEYASYVFFPKAGADGYALEINADMAGVLEVLGEPLSYFEAESCAFQGMDKTYTYAGFIITTRPEGDSDYVNSIRLTDDSVTTAEGIYIGCSQSAVIDTYGEDSGDLPSTLVYKKGDSAINFLIQEDKVISIEYLPAQ